MRYLSLIPMIAISSAYAANDHVRNSSYVPEGYKLIISSEFDSDLNDANGNALWSDKYLAHWTATGEESKAEYEFENGALKLLIRKKQQAWDPKYDDETIISGIQTANKNLLHRWNANYPIVAEDVPSPQKIIENHIQKYGYFELKAKTYQTINGGGVHTAWWMVGFQEDSDSFVGRYTEDGVLKPRTKQTAEVDIFETLGRNTWDVQTAFHSWGGNDNIRWIRHGNADVNTADDFNVYGFLWTPENMRLYFNGRLIAQTTGSVHYPMLTLLGIYEKRHSSPQPWTGILTDYTYPKSFEIDYWRSYMPNDMLNSINEAEYGALSKNAITKYEVQASNGYVVSNLGMGEDLTYKAVYSSASQEYRLDVDYFYNSDEVIMVSVNDGLPIELVAPRTLGENSSKVTTSVHLNKGFNQIRLYNNSADMPDIDKIVISKY